MNERIRELAVEAKLNSDAVPYHLDDYFSLGPYEAVDKFAELIVRECINEIHVADVGELNGKGYYLDKVAEHIEKYFGVTE